MARHLSICLTTPCLACPSPGAWCTWWPRLWAFGRPPSLQWTPPPATSRPMCCTQMCQAGDGVGWRPLPHGSWLYTCAPCWAQPDAAGRANRCSSVAAGCTGGPPYACTLAACFCCLSRATQLLASAWGSPCLLDGPPTISAGTSFSTPMTAGAAALLWAARPGLTYQQVRCGRVKPARSERDPAASGLSSSSLHIYFRLMCGMCRRALLSTVTKRAALKPYVRSGGILNIAAALAAVWNPQRLPWYPVVVPPYPTKPPGNWGRGGHPTGLWQHSAFSWQRGVGGLHFGRCDSPPARPQPPIICLLAATFIVEANTFYNISFGGSPSTHAAATAMPNWQTCQTL